LTATIKSNKNQNDVNKTISGEEGMDVEINKSYRAKEQKFLLPQRQMIPFSLHFMPPRHIRNSQLIVFNGILM
jgi:hypothetical protein